MSRSQILITEDENIVAMDIQSALQNSKYDVAGVASSGLDAIEKAALTRPDLVLMDIRLKGEMDGVEAAAKIRESLDVPIIYLTAYSDKDTVHRAKLTEPFGYLLKPFEKKELQTAIEMALYKHKAEKALRENRRWLSAILTGTGDAIVATDQAGLVTFMNPPAEILSGWKSDELKGRAWTDAFRFLEPDGATLTLEREFLEGKSARLSPHTTLLGRDGARRPVDGNLAPIRDEKGLVTGFVLAFRDVTERKRLEEELRKANRTLEQRVQERTEALADSESKFRSIAETAPDGVVVIDGEGGIVFCNRSTQTLFGYMERELRGRKMLQLIPARNHELLNNTIQDLAGDGERHQTLELHGRDKAGREFPIELSLSTWQAGDRRFYSGILRDVSERQQAEMSLRFQAGILSQVKDAVVATDGEGAVVYWNRGAERLFNLRTVEVMGRELDEILNESGARWLSPEAEKQVEAALARSDVWHGETTHKRKDGTESHLELSVGSLRDEKDSPVGKLMVLRDVTERKRLEGMLIHSEKLAAMGQMAAGIAHEIKTPLGMIFWFAEVLQGKDSTEEERKEMLGNLKRQVERCTNLVNNVLGFSRKGRRIEEAEIDVNAVVTSALALVTPHAVAKKSVIVRWELAPDPLRVRGVKDMLEQVVVNLALNSVDSMPEGGTLTLTTRSLRKGDAPFIQIEVADTGAGIPPEVRERIFEPFFTTKDNGTGLGLWLVKQIVTGFRGDIECSSEVGKGAFFTITIPEAVGPLK